jgi:hypothetical protein
MPVSAEAAALRAQIIRRWRIRRQLELEAAACATPDDVDRCEDGGDRCAASTERSTNFQIKGLRLVDETRFSLPRAPSTRIVDVLGFPKRVTDQATGSRSR